MNELDQFIRQCADDCVNGGSEPPKKLSHYVQTVNTAEPCPECGMTQRERTGRGVAFLELKVTNTHATVWRACEVCARKKEGWQE